MKINVSEILQSVAPHCSTDAEFDALLVRECIARFGDERQEVLRGINELLQGQVREHGGSRLDAAVRLLPKATATKIKGSSVKDLPPDIRARLRDVATPHSREGRASRAPAATRSLKSWMLLAALGVAVFCVPLGIQLRRMRGAGLDAPRTPVERTIADLEAEQRATTGDAASSFRLCEAYASKIVMTRILRLANDVQGGEASGADPELAMVAQALAQAVSSPSDASVQLAARQGDALISRLLAAPDVSAGNRAAADVMWGYFMLAQGRHEEAFEAARRVAALDEADPRPHLLRALIHQALKEYGAAIEENQAAQSKVGAWLSSKPGLMEHMLWATGDSSEAAFLGAEGWRQVQLRSRAAVELGMRLHVKALKMKL